jgi:hypothetical protein
MEREKNKDSEEIDTPLFFFFLWVTPLFGWCLLPYL